MSESRTGIVSEKKKKHIESMIELGKKRVIAEFITIDNETNQEIESCKEFNSMKECAKYFNISKDTVTKYCKSGEYCKKCKACFSYKEQLTEQSN